MALSEDKGKKKKRFKDGTYEIIGAAMEVHRALGPGLLEAAYQVALAMELEIRGIDYVREVKFPIKYKGKDTNKYYQVDFICKNPDPVVVELKALKEIGNWERAVSLNYLRLSRYKIGLLLNFGANSLQYERFVNFRNNK